MEIALIVIRTKDMERIVSFYSLLGLEFEYHQHNNSPFHYSAKVDKGILEIYPLAKGYSEVDASLRLGFRISNFEYIINELKEASVHFAIEPSSSDWGVMAVVVDPDGRKIELYEK